MLPKVWPAAKYADWDGGQSEMKAISILVRVIEAIFLQSTFISENVFEAYTNADKFWILRFRRKVTFL